MIGSSAGPAFERESGYSLIELLIVVGISSVLAAVAVPMMKNTIGDFKLSGDARGLNNAVSLAKLRAASDFSQSRLFVALDTRQFHVETWSKTAVPNDWVLEGGVTSLSSGVIFGFSVVGAAPPNTQAVIGQASQCLNRLGVAIGNTACVLFNSRGIPVATGGVPPAVGAPTANYALYITDGTAVYGVTLSATGLINLWRTNPVAAGAWKVQ
jgi:prepilin-type N-terminal cleavage/methylation domain-containing protein